MIKSRKLTLLVAFLFLCCLLVSSVLAGPCDDAKPGDADGSGDIGLNDMNYLLSYLSGGAPPVPLENGDANGDCVINQDDVTYIQNIVFAGWPKLECTCLVDEGGGGCCIGIRGNADNDPLDEFDIADVVLSVNYIFNDGPAPACEEEADVNGVDGFDVSDVVHMVNYIFFDGVALMPCP